MKVLPPGLQSLSSHTFGSLFIQVSDLRLNKSQQLTHFKPKFFGQNTDENTNFSNMPVINQNDNYKIGLKIQYKIVTNLWLFYLYLSDMQNIDIQLFNLNSRIPACMTKAEMSLKSAKVVMAPSFKDKNIFKYSDDERQSIVDSNGSVIGSINIKLWSDFDVALHQQIKELIDFSSMIVFQGISPINSQNQLPRQPPQQISSIMSQSNLKQRLKNLNSQISQEKQPFELLESQIKEGDGLDEHRLIEQDIDKLIMEMQSRPYDSSRYQQTKNQSIKSSTGSDFHLSHSQQNFASFNKNSYHDSHSSHKFLQTQASLKHIPSRPPTYSSYSKNRSQSTKVENKAVINNSQRVIKGQSLSNRSYSQTFTKSNDSCIELKIHEMQFSLSNAIPHTIFSQFVQPCYTMKIYLNNDLQQYFAGQGVKEGQIIKFNLSLKLRNINNVEKIRFSICDDYGKVQCEGIFDLSRLYSSNNQKGVYIISLLPVVSQQPKPQIKVTQNKLVQISPLVRTLRIQAELIERVQMVQIFMKISKATLPFNMLRYKIPLTKQTIEHMGGNHINIFPHTCSQQVYDKLIVQFWKNEQNIGQSQISLKNIRNVNINTLNSNMDPTYLYDGKKQIRNIFAGDRVVGDFNLTLCFGNVKQMQLLLISAIDQEKQMSRPQSKKVETTIDDRLGVIVYKKPAQSNEVSIQVQLEDEKINTQPNKVHQQIIQFNQPSFGDQSIISHTSLNQFMDASIVSFAKNHPLQQIIKVEQQANKKIPLPTLTQKIGQMVSELLLPICQKLPKIKQLCKPQLLYNFISVDAFTQILTKLDFKMKLVNKILKIAVFPKENMININILYDLCASISIQGNIKPHLVNDEMLIVGAMRLLYRKQSMRKQIMIQHDMQFKQMIALFQKVQLKLTLHQFQTLQKFMSNYKTKQQAENLKHAIICQLEQQTMQQLKQGFYQQDILKQIYGNQSSISQSQISDLNQSIQSKLGKYQNNDTQLLFKETQPIQKKTQTNIKNNDQFMKQTMKPSVVIDVTQKRQKLVQTASVKIPAKSPQKIYNVYKCRLLIDGVQNVLQSAQCVFDQPPKNSCFRIIIDSPLFEQLSFNGNERVKQFQASQELKDVDGRAEFMGDGKVLACAAFSLIRGVDSLYPMKTKDGHFCGLLKIKLL